ARAGESMAVGQCAGRVDRELAVVRAPRAHRIVILQAEADRIHALMTRCTERVRAMLLQALAQRYCGSHTGFLQRRDFGRRWRWRRAQKILQYPLAAQHRRRTCGIRRDSQHAALGEDAAALRALQAHSLKLFAVDAANAVMAREWS